jgi:uncharacterized BrkB/YihY/UPF0761 family membrane protein
MAEGTAPVAAGPEKINLPYHVIIGVAAGMVAAFTALAWPVALFLGYIVGRDQVERMHGVRNPAATNILRALLIVIGVGAMLFLGAIFGGLIAIVIIALVAFSERIAGNASTTDQGIARILVFIVAAATWGILFVVLKPNINISIG